MVSILQMMGFSKAKATDAPAKEATAKRGQATSARRQDVKAQSGKDTKGKAIPAKPAPASKAAAKAPAKAAAKSAPKPASKPAVKPAVKVAAKPAVKSVAKPPVAKTPSKVAVKTPAKVPVATKPVKSAKPAAQPAGKTVAKAPIKSVAKSPTPVSAPAKPAAKAKAASSAPAVAVKEKKPMSANPTPAKSTPAPVATPAPAKAGRPSSRLAQLTVPSIAQSVASTAAKASYSQEESLPAIIPVLPAAMKKDAKLVNSWKTKPVAELTDADLIAMPDSEYMNDVQMAAFRLKLVVLKTDILSNAGETTEHLREDSAVVPDPADRATIEEEHALELRTRDRERKLLKKIEQSIARIDAGDYGYCDETGEAIGVGRLLARPTATLSLEAQQRRELKQKMFGD